MDEAVKKEVSKYQEAITNYGKKGISTYTFTCETGETCILREPTVRETGEILPSLTPIGDKEPNLIDAGIKIIDMCWIAGDSEIRKNDDLLCEVALASVNTIKLRIADVKKN